MEQAYLRTMEVGKRPREDASLRMSIENLSATSMVPYQAFQRNEFIRLLKEGGNEAQCELSGVKEWDYEKGGYQVQLVYQVSTPVVRFELILPVMGKESLTGEYEGRQWHVVMEKHQVERPLMKFTPEGEQLLRALSRGSEFAQNWIKALEGGEMERSYLETLPPAERARQERARAKAPSGVGPAAGPGANLARDPEGQAYQAGKAAFLEGGLVQANPKTFWASDPKAVIEGVKDIFRPLAASASRIELAQIRMPEWDHVDGKLRGRYDVQIGLFDRAAIAAGEGNPVPRFIVDGMLVVESTAAAGKEDAKSWRVVSLDLIRGKVPGPEAAMPRRGMRPR
jgi:hypothetical protein